MKAVLLALAVASGLIGTVTCGGAAELRVGFTTDPLTLDPANHRSRETENIIRNMYDGVLTRDSKMTIEPELAEFTSRSIQRPGSSRSDRASSFTTAAP